MTVLVHRSLVACAVVASSLALPDSAVVAQTKITSPREAFGHQLGDDYFLANYHQLTAYWQTLAEESERMNLEVIGESEEGRDILMAVITSSRNQKRIERLRKISRRLTLANDLEDDEARGLANEGRVVVWIDGGLHATEVLGAQQLMEMSYQLVSRDDEETRRFLNRCVILLCNPNPDGHDLVADWYMRQESPSKRSTRNLPRLYQKYIGHDNNRDFYMVTQKETEAVCRVFYERWFPQIVYNHHQSGPSGTVLFAPPFRGPFNHNFDPLVPLGIDLVGASMHSRFAVEGKPGATMRRGASYSTWWNGGLRTNVYFHNMIGLLTETIGNPTPMEIPVRLQRLLATADTPNPIQPQEWHFRQSVEYSLTANRAVLDVASRHYEQFLYNAYRMGRNSIDRGSKDHWTIRPHRLAEAETLQQSESSQQAYRSLLKPELRDPRAFILPADQPDFLTATRFIQTLQKNGVLVERATEALVVGEKKYPAGSYVVRTNQAFRPHIIDMFEPQDHPDDIAYPGGPPRPPYDSAGWTLAFQMGLQFDRILDGVTGPLEPIGELAQPPAGRLRKARTANGFLWSPQTNDGFLAANVLLRKGERVSRLRKPITVNDTTWPAGTWFVDKQGSTVKFLRELAQQQGLVFQGIAALPDDAERQLLRRPRIGLWDRYGGSMASGWVRWILEQFEFEFEVVYGPALDVDDLQHRFDVLIFVGGGIPSGSGRRRLPAKDDVPEIYHDRLGQVTIEKTVPRLRKFLEDGGTVLTIGSSTVLARHLKLPLENPLVRRDASGTSQSLSREEYYVPGSILRVRVNNQHPLAWGAPEELDVYFSRSPVFRLLPAAAGDGIAPVAWFDQAKPLRSGWAWGQHHLHQTTAVVAAPVGQGHLALFGPEVSFRAQPHGTFKLLFNGIYWGR